MYKKTYDYFFFIHKDTNTVKHYTHTNTAHCSHRPLLHITKLQYQYIFIASYVIIIIYSVNIICILIVFNIQFFISITGRSGKIIVLLLYYCCMIKSLRVIITIFLSARGPVIL